MSAAETGAKDALVIEDLTLTTRATGEALVTSASLRVCRGEVHALVGESGSGKTLLSRCAIGLLPGSIERTSGSLYLAGRNVSDLTNHQWRELRGARIGMVFQEPMVSLNPGMKIGSQMTEAYRLHRNASEKHATEKALEMLELFNVSRPEERMSQYPHEFSGGMRQRIMLAAVMMLEPDVLLADEPTTALDAVVQKDVLDTMVAATRKLDTAVLLVTHDLGVVGRYADSVTVINQGQIEESGTAQEIISHPKEEYTRHLLLCSPANRVAPKSSPCTRAALEVENLEVEFSLPRKKIFGERERVTAVDDVTFALGQGEMLGLVGESGSGKSTIGRAVLGLIPQANGRVYFAGEDILGLAEQKRRKLRPKMQLIFQDPYSSLNPRLTVEKAVEAALLHLPPGARSFKAAETLEATGLGASFLNRFPHELSGGQRQRVCIARALASDPEFIVADEAVSALDVSVQAQILDLLVKLQEQRKFACLFISHDLDVVRSVCSRTIVLKEGRIVEQGATEDILKAPQQEYTQRLVEAFPSLAA